MRGTLVRTTGLRKATGILSGEADAAHGMLCRSQSKALFQPC